MTLLKPYKKITKACTYVNNINFSSYLTHNFLIAYLINNTIIFNLLKYIKFYVLIKNIVKKIYKKKGTFLIIAPKNDTNILNIWSKIPKCYYLNQKWKSGLLTNFLTVKKQLNKIKNVNLNLNNKRVNKKNKLQKKEFYKGLSNMNSLPDIVFLLSKEKSQVIISECFLLGIIPILLAPLCKTKFQSPYYVFGNKNLITFLLKNLFINISDKD